MSYRYHGRARVDPSNPDPFAICDRCNMRYNKSALNWQKQYSGAALVDKHLLVCSKCLDEPQPQLKTFVPSIDPIPVKNPRPDNADSQINYIVTQNGVIIASQNGNLVISD